MAERKFRFGVSGRGNTASEWQAFAKKAEDLGYSTLVLPDHFTQQMAPLPALAAAAQVTSTLRFGTIVLAENFRHPAVLAKEAATLDVLTDGRFELAIGTGSREEDNTETGLPSYPPGERVGRIQETVEILKAFAADEKVSFQGKYYQLRDLLAYPRPVQQPRIPLFIGARQSRMLRFAAREADIVGILGTDDEAGPGGSFAEKAAVVREAAGERYGQLEINRLYLRVEIDGQPPTAPQFEGRAGLVGSRGEVIEKLQSDRELYDVSYVVVIGPSIDAFAPIVAELAGK